LSDREKMAFDRYCLTTAGPTFEPPLPEPLPPCLRGAVARLALEAAELARRYTAKRSQLEKSLRDRGMSNPTVLPGFLQSADEAEKQAMSKLVGRWRRGLTQDQQAVFDDGTDESKKPISSSHPKTKRKRRSRIAELLLALLDDRTYANNSM